MSRLAPETPFPAAVHDAREAVLWVQNEGASLLSLNTKKLSLGGSSAGGNLAAVMAHQAAIRGGPTFLSQLLIVPVTDATAKPFNNSSYRDFEHTPALPALKMQWYINHYLPREADRALPDASPLLYEGDSWPRQPQALIVLGGLDVLRSEGEEYAAKLRKAGVEVELVVMDGIPHPFVAMDGVLDAGREAITHMVDTLKKVNSM
jgi:acetyl esterase/lipase